MVEDLKNSALPRAISDVFAGVVELLQKELQLARAEISAKLSTKMRAGVWMALTAFSGLIAVLLVVQGVVFGIATFGIALHWACLIVAAFFLAVAIIAYGMGRSDARDDLAPTRTINQVKKDIQAVKEQLT